MRLSFREFHLQFDPTLRRERVPEAMLELIGPTPSVKPVFEGPSPTAPSTAPAAMDAASDAQLLANGSAAALTDGAAAAPADAAADGAGVEAAVAPADDQQHSAGLEPVPELAAQLFAQVIFIGTCNCRTMFIVAMLLKCFYKSQIVRLTDSQTYTICQKRTTRLLGVMTLVQPMQWCCLPKACKTFLTTEALIPDRILKFV